MSGLYIPPLPVITPWSLEASGSSLGVIISNGSFFTNVNIAWGTADKALFIPFQLSAPQVVTKLWALNGLALTGSWDIGIYDHAGTRIVSTGGTAQSTDRAIQSVDTPDAFLDRGEYYMALVANNASTDFKGNASVSAIRLSTIGWKEQASAYPLPATASWVRTTMTTVPIFGLLLYPRTVI